jgi:2,3-bisphosphoglycerate-independent phosphoglycerate mutase
MKYLVILADGLADEPLESLNGQTPVMAANTPNIDKLCSLSKTGLLKTVPDTLHPGSEVANMTIMGYDAEKYYEGRGVLEAAALGVQLEEDDLVFRCNLVTADEGVLVNHSAGHISTEEAKQLITFLNEKLGNDYVQFHSGVSYRHVLIMKHLKGPVDCTPPHDVPGEAIQGILPKSKTEKNTAYLLSKLMLSSKAILEKHPVNLERKRQGKPMANMIWPWSPGHRPAMPTLLELYGLSSGAVISAVDLVHGLGRLAGLTSVFVEGATGLYDTNYSGKAQAALKALETHDYVYLHIEAPDEAGHEGDVALKIRTLEDIDRLVVGPVMKSLMNGGEEVTIAFLPDHPTPCAIRTHTRTAVPFVMYKPGQKADNVSEYNEFSVEQGGYGKLAGTEFMSLLLKKK